MNDVERAFQSWYCGDGLADDTWWCDECETYHSDECPRESEEWQSTIQLIAKSALVSDDAADMPLWLATHTNE